MSKKYCSLKEKMFVDYLIGESHFSQSDAARRAGYRNPPQDASIVLRREKVQKYLAARLQDTIISREETLQLLTDIARANLNHFTRDDGTIDLASEDAKNNFHLLRRVKQKERRHYARDGAHLYSDFDTEVELWDKVAVLSLVAKFHGMLNDTVIAQTITNNSLIVNAAPQTNIIERMGLDSDEVWQEVALMMQEREQKLIDAQVEPEFNLENNSSDTENDSSIVDSILTEPDDAD